MKKLYHISLSAFFMVVVLWSAYVFFLVDEGDETSQSENRALAKLPTFAFKDIEKYPARFNKYWNDHFGGRQVLIGAHHRLKMDYLNVPPVLDKVMLGKNDWYFIKGKSYDSYIGRNKFTPAQLAQGLKEQKRRAAIMKEKGISYYIFNAPVKHRIYPEHLPNLVQRHEDSTQIEQMVELFSKHDDIHFYDLAPDLIAAKEVGRLYDKTDNHWNELGAYFAYRKVMEVIAKDFPDMKPIPLEQFSIDIQTTDGRQLAKMMKMQKTLQEERIILNPKFEKTGRKVSEDAVNVPKGFERLPAYQMHYVNSDSTKPRMLFIRDSFGKFLNKELREHFSDLLFIFDKWEYKLNEDIIEEYQPDVVICMVLERNLECLMVGGGCGGNF